MSISKIHIPNFVCVFSQIKDGGAGVSQNFSKGICGLRPIDCDCSYTCCKKAIMSWRKEINYVLPNILLLSCKILYIYLVKWMVQW